MVAITSHVPASIISVTCVELISSISMDNIAAQAEMAAGSGMKRLCWKDTKVSTLKQLPPPLDSLCASVLASHGLGGLVTEFRSSIVLAVHGPS